MNAGAIRGLTPTTRVGRRAGQRAVKEAVVFGAGLAGLGSSIALARRGVKVTLLEWRQGAPTRAIRYNADDAMVQALQRLGVLERLLPKYRLTGAVGIVRAGRSDLQAALKPSSRAPRSAVEAALPVSARRAPVAAIPSVELESSLRSRADELGVDLRTGVTARLVPGKEGRYGVELSRPVRINGARSSVPTGELLAVPDLIVVADGTHSATRAGLHIPFIEETAAFHELAGYVETRIGPTAVRIINPAENGQAATVKLTGDPFHGGTWAVIHSSSEAGALSGDSAREYFTSELSTALGRRVVPDQVSAWGDHTARIVNRQAASLTAGENVVLVGEAARAGRNWNSVGARLALNEDVANLERLVVERNAGVEALLAQQAFDKRGRAAAQRFLQEGVDEFEALSVR